MLFSTVDQGWIFLLMFAAGATIGALWDALALLRRLLAAGFFLSLAADLLLGLGAAGVLIAAITRANYGQPRAYMLPAVGLGIALYAFGVARPLHALLGRAGRLFARLGARAKENRIIKIIFR